MHYIRREFPQPAIQRQLRRITIIIRTSTPALTHSLDCVYNSCDKEEFRMIRKREIKAFPCLLWSGLVLCDLIWFFSWMDDLTCDQPQLHYYQSIVMHFKEFIKGRSSIGFLAILPQMFPLMFYPQIGQAFYTISGCDEPLTQCCVHLPFRSPVITDINSGC